MTEVTSKNLRLRDPFLIRETGTLQTEKGQRYGRWQRLLALCVGIFDGLAVLALVPLTRALVQGTAVAPWLWGLALIALLAFGARFFSTLWSYFSALDFLHTAHTVIGDKLATLPLGWFGAHNTGGLSRLVSDRFMAAAETVAHMQSTIVRDSAALVTLVVGAWVWNPRLGLTLTLMAPVVVLVVQVAAWIRKRAADQALPPAQELSGRIVEFAAHQPALRAAGRSDEFAQLQQALQADQKARVRELWLSTFALVLNGVVVQAFIVALITVAAQVPADPLETIAVIGISLRFSRAVDQVGSAYVGLDLGRVALTEARQISCAPSLPEPAQPTVPTGAEAGRVELRDVSFGYGHTPVLRNVSFVAQPGTLTAIVGPSGSGKTTIARLISRFWDVDSGVVLVDGVDIRQLGTEQLMSRLSMVFQDVYLFDDSLLANIRVGRPSASDQEVYQAADLAGVTSIAQRLGWHSRVGEAGRLLSGGERQRVSVARALLKQAPIVIFDEATSALDAENEANILASMEALRSRSTLIVIAHKLDTIRNADQIVVLDHTGHVSQVGTHAQLGGTPGIYQQFLRRREAAHGWALGSPSA
ncbi:ABC transporter ATP-binding protein [Corynebacterium lizhenjunii]|uniref:ABC transporter ATP-binding protein n=1 Tax=Corynebacterium lizhenjunii TaxID=2709394 RepID=A0A7T0KDX4_9CORY|nr:ABC transporter ATP-binding protein [Corynebacterium lizhenjunii]QPK78996.1 ABC transporter ATP-binding protein [Corynebacterium lizhenjunii]